MLCAFLPTVLQRQWDAHKEFVRQHLCCLWTKDHCGARWRRAHWKHLPAFLQSCVSFSWETIWSSWSDPGRQISNNLCWVWEVASQVRLFPRLPPSSPPPVPISPALLSSQAFILLPILLLETFWSSLLNTELLIQGEPSAPVSSFLKRNLSVTGTGSLSICIGCWLDRWWSHKWTGIQEGPGKEGGSGVRKRVKF